MRMKKKREVQALGAGEAVKFQGEFFFCEGIDELGAGRGKPKDTMMAVNHKDHLAFLIQPGSMLWEWLVIPKSDILRWQTATLSEILDVRGPSAGKLFASGLLTGALGAYSDVKQAKARAEAQGISITYSSDGTETTVFFRPKGWTSTGTSQYYENLNRLMGDVLPTTSSSALSG